MAKGDEDAPKVGTTVAVNRDGKRESKTFDDESMGVRREVRAWAEGLKAGKPNPAQSIEEAMNDLEIVSPRTFGTTAIVAEAYRVPQLQAMIQSGEKNGVPIDLKPL